MVLINFFSPAIDLGISVELTEVSDVGIDLFFDVVADLDVPEQQQIDDKLSEKSSTLITFIFRKGDWPGSRITF